MIEGEILLHAKRKRGRILLAYKVGQLHLRQANFQRFNLFKIELNKRRGLRKNFSQIKLKQDNSI